MADANRPHRRLNLLTGRHVLVSPQRALRPWQGQAETPAAEARPAYDPTCYLCPRNERVGGEANPDYAGVYVFDNDFPALLPADATDPDAVFGRNRVLCYSPDHCASLGDLPLPQLTRVIDVWADETEMLSRTHAHVQIFENKGAAMGASNPHPHGQAWATSFVPDEVALEDEKQSAWFAEHGEPLLAGVAAREAVGARLVEQSKDWLAIVPYWATWPFELLLLPRFPVARMPELSPGQRESLAAMLQAIVRRYDSLFGVPFPYSMGWHGAPTRSDPAPWQLHAHFYPPLLRSATVRKFMVGFEMLAEAQRDLTPEQAAARLRGEA